MDPRTGPPRYEDPRMTMMGQSNMSSVPGFSHMNYPIRDSTQGVLGMAAVSVPDNHITFTNRPHYTEMPVQQNSLNASKMPVQQNSLNVSKMSNQQNSLNVDIKTEEENIRLFMEAANETFLKIKEKELTVKQAAVILGRPYSFVYTRYHEFCHQPKRKIEKERKKERPKLIKIEPKQHESELHSHRHTRERPFMCGICEKTFVTLGNLKTHQIVHEEGIVSAKKKKSTKKKKSAKKKKYVGSKKINYPKKINFVCKQCGRGFNSTYNLVEHMNVHAGTFPYACDMCDARFNFKSGLDRHKVSHGKEEPFQCNLCPMKFHHEKSYIQHQLVHSNFKPYKCDLCDFATKRKLNLQYHKNTHTGETPFKCNFDGCTAAFAKPGSLRHHKSKHEQPQKTCKVCYEKFPDLQSFKRHKLIHTGGKLEECDQCGKTFVDKPALKRHMNMHLYKPPGTKTKQVRQPRKNPSAKKTIQPGTNQKIWNNEYNSYGISSVAANAEDTSSQHCQQTFNAFSAVSQQYSNLVNSNLAMVNNAWPSNMDHDDLRRRFLSNYK